MKQINLKTALVITLLNLSLFSLSAQAATTGGVGKAIISIGKVFTTSKGGQEKKLKRRGKVYEGDTIKVGKKSRLQLRFIDNQLVVLKANTVFRIDEYKFKDKNDNNKSAALSLLKGGMRSVTGLIGKSARDKYKVRTPVATMGVRGTHYILQVCDGNCGDGVIGLVGTVLEGEIEMTNDGGTSTFGTDQFFNVPSPKDPPRTITNPPASLVSKAETEKNEEDSEDNGDGDGGDEGEETVAADEGGDEPADDTSTSDTTSDTTTTETTVTSGEETDVETTTGTVSTNSQFYVGTAAPVGAVGVFGGISDEANGAGGTIGTQGGNATLNLENVNGVGNQLVNSTFTQNFGESSFQVKIGAVASEQGGIPALGVNWGRWAASDVVLTDELGGTQSLLTGLSFIYSDNPTPDSTILSLVTAGVGLLSFDLVDGPFIRDESGGIVSGGISVAIDFGTSGTATPAVVGFSGSLAGSDGRAYNNFLLVNNVNLTDLQAGAELMITAECSGGICLSLTNLFGTAGGTLIGANAEALIAYFGLNDTAGLVAISGTGVFADLGAQ